MEGFADRMLWGTLMRHGEVNLETACTIHRLTQRRISNASADEVEPDRSEFWYATDGRSYLAT